MRLQIFLNKKQKWFLLLIALGFAFTIPFFIFSPKSQESRFDVKEFSSQRETKVKWLLSSLLKGLKYNFIFSESKDRLGLSLIIEGPVKDDFRKELIAHMQALFPESHFEIAISSLPTIRNGSPKKEGASLWFFALFLAALFIILGFLFYEKEPNLFREKDLSKDLKKKLLDKSSLRKEE